MKMSKTIFLFAGLLAFSASAMEYAVGGANASDENDGSSESPFATIDKAVATATSNEDVIYVAPGSYTTATQHGPNLKAKLIGTGASRDEVIISAGSSQRTLRMAAGSWLENVTVVGETTKQVDKGGAVELSGGTATNCVFRDGSTKGASDNRDGGNVYLAGTSLIVDSLITGGSCSKRGGNVYLNGGTVRACTIEGGVSANVAGNVFIEAGTLEACTITEGTATNDGGNIYIDAGTISDCTVSGGSGKEGGAIRMRGGSLLNSTVTANGTTKGSGAGLYMTNDKGSPLVDGCTIDGTGSTLSYHGGCIYMKNGTVRNTTCQNGLAKASRCGGNIYMENGTLSKVTLKSGRAGAEGGNLYANGSSTISDCVIQDGSVVTDAESKGANVYLVGSAKLIRCQVRGGTSFKADGETIGYNRGSVCASSSSTVIENCLVSDSACGGILLASGGHKLYNTTVVNNNKYGLWCWSTSQYFYNCVFFGNYLDEKTTASDWTGNQPSGSTSALLNCAVAETGPSRTTYPTLVVVTDKDFADYANGDYRPTRTSALVDAGTPDPRGASASETDLDGSPRLSGNVDIGCYEYQKLDLIVHIDGLTYEPAYAPATVTFTHMSENSASPENVTFTYDFGDGTTNETTSALAMTHVYETPGVYTVKITANNACEEESAEMTYANYAKVASSVVCVKAGGTATFPYNTPETGYATLKEAVAAAPDGYTIQLSPGVYETADQTPINKSVSVIGQGATPADVVLRNTTETPNTYYHRTVDLSGAGAVLANVTIENGCVRNVHGGNLRISNGACVSNCVIRGGRAVAENGNAAGSAVSIGGQNGILTHCVITGNRTEGASNDQNYAGGAVFIEYGAKNVHLSNLLIAGNVYATTNTVKHGTAGIRFGGGNDWTTVENCTIVANTVEGSLPDDSAGLYCTSWHCLIRNNIIVGNVERDKEDGKATSVKLDFNGGSSYKYTYNITDDALIEGSVTKSYGNQLVADVATLFQDFAAGDYSLKPDSPAANKTSAADLALVPSVDLAGNPRTFGRMMDIGCYECQIKRGLSILFR